jgi:hypothetical protein
MKAVGFVIFDKSRWNKSRWFWLSLIFLQIKTGGLDRSRLYRLNFDQIEKKKTLASLD